MIMRKGRKKKLKARKASGYEWLERKMDDKEKGRKGRGLEEKKRR